MKANEKLKEKKKNMIKNGKFTIDHLVLINNSSDKSYRFFFFKPIEKKQDVKEKKSIQK